MHGAPLSSHGAGNKAAAPTAVRGGPDTQPGCAGGSEVATGANSGIGEHWHDTEGRNTPPPPGPLPRTGGTQRLGGGFKASRGNAQRLQTAAELLWHPARPLEMGAEEVHAMFPTARRGMPICKWMLSGNREARSHASPHT